MNMARLDGKLMVLSRVVGVSASDFNFDRYFACSHQHRFERIDMEDPPDEGRC